MNEDFDATFTFRLDSTTKKTVELVAKCNDESLAGILRRAINNYLAENAEAAAQLSKVAKKSRK